MILHHPLAEGRTVREQELWTFPEGLIGVPDLRRFALVPLEQVPPFELLCSIDAPEFGIVVVDPRTLIPDYVLSLTAEDLMPLREPEPGRLAIRVPVVLPSERAPLTLNLKGPVVLSPREMIGVQRISPDERHDVRFAPDLTGTGTPSCSS